MLRLVEIAELLGVSKQRAHQLAGESGFPSPVGQDARGDCGLGETLRRGRSGGVLRSPGGNHDRNRRLRKPPLTHDSLQEARRASTFGSCPR